MSVILEAKERLLLIKRAIYAIISEEAAVHQNYIAELNRSQLEKGERADESLLPDYSPVSVSQYGKPPGPMVLFDEGDFYDGIKPIFEDDGFDMVGLDRKTGMLIDKYGELILGLNEENKQKLAIRLLPGVRRRIKNLL